MKVLMVEPGRVPYETEIGDRLADLQAAVGGDIQAVYPFEDPVALVCNEEGKLMGLPLNRALYDENGQVYEIIAGKFFLAGLGEEDFSDLSANLMEKYAEQFQHPEDFVRIAGRYLVVKMAVPTMEKPQMRPEAKRETSIKEQLDAAKKQAAQAEPKAAEKKPRTPERS